MDQPQNISEALKALKEGLLNPSSAFGPAERQHRARLLKELISAFLVSLVMLLAAVSFSSPETLPAKSRLIQLLICAGLCTSMSFYLTQRVRYEVGALFFSAGIVLTTFMILSIGPSRLLLYSTLPYLSIAIILAGTLLNLTYLFLLFVANGIGIYALTRLLPWLPQTDAWNLILFDGAVFLVSWIGMRIRNSDLQQLQSQRDRSERNAKMAALGETASGIGHEISNPLQLMAGYGAQLRLLVDKDNVRPEALLKISEGIKNSVERMTSIVNSLKTFSRDSKRDDFKDVSVSKCVATAVALCQESYRNSKIKLEVGSIPGDLQFSGKLIDISQVLLNLFNNAKDAVEKQEDRWVKIEVNEFEDKIQIRVTDSGPGIPPDIEADMFDAFFTTKPEGEGTGLGLSICRTTAERHGGSLELDSQSAHTCFILTLPKTIVAPVKIAA